MKETNSITSSRDLTKAMINKEAITLKTPTKSLRRISPTTLILLTGNILTPNLESFAMLAGNPAIMHMSVALLGDVRVHNINRGLIAPSTL